MPCLPPRQSPPTRWDVAVPDSPCIHTRRRTKCRQLIIEGKVNLKDYNYSIYLRSFRHSPRLSVFPLQRSDLAFLFSLHCPHLSPYFPEPLTWLTPVESHPFSCVEFSGLRSGRFTIISFPQYTLYMQWFLEVNNLLVCRCEWAGENWRFDMKKCAIWCEHCRHPRHKQNTE